ncbi:hypothetical protein AHAS_Ahas19G0066200 [Arachis hypogaea]
MTYWPHRSDSNQHANLVIVGGVVMAALQHSEHLCECKTVKLHLLSNAFVTTLRKDEQFLWAGSEMDSEYAEEARLLVQDIDTALSRCLSWNFCTPELVAYPST